MREREKVLILVWVPLPGGLEISFANILSEERKMRERRERKRERGKEREEKRCVHRQRRWS